MKNTSNLTCDQLHQKAMDFAHMAVKAKKQGLKTEAQEHFDQAFNLEKQAAMTLAPDFNAEPSRSILFRSAAFLALQAQQYREAERMAAFGLIGQPPPEIAAELREAFQESQAHLKLVA